METENTRKYKYKKNNTTRQRYICRVHSVSSIETGFALFAVSLSLSSAWGIPSLDSRPVPYALSRPVPSCMHRCVMKQTPPQRLKDVDAP